MLNITPTLPECLMTRSKVEVGRWHARYRHVNFHALKSLNRKQMVCGLPIIEHEDRVCDGCLVGKQHINSFPTGAQSRAKSPLKLWHGDLCGLITPVTNGGKCYFFLLVDDCTRFMWVVLIQSKDGMFKKTKASVEMERNNKLKAFHTYRGVGCNSPRASSRCIVSC